MPCSRTTQSLLPFSQQQLFRLLATTGAEAFAIGGSVTGGAALGQGGIFEKLNVPFNPPNGNLNEVGADTFETPNLYVFDEDQNITITAGLAVDIGTAPMAGDVVASHYVFFDPNDPSNSTNIQGYVDFDADIFGIATTTSNLSNSDFLANTGVVYLNPTLRGLEFGDSVSIDPTNPRRLLVDFTAGTPGDYVRVLTMESVIPEPSTGLLVSTGLLGLAARRRRTLHQSIDAPSRLHSS